MGKALAPKRPPQATAAAAALIQAKLIKDPALKVDPQDNLDKLVKAITPGSRVQEVTLSSVQVPRMVEVMVGKVDMEVMVDKVDMEVMVGKVVMEVMVDKVVMEVLVDKVVMEVMEAVTSTETQTTKS